MGDMEVIQTEGAFFFFAGGGDGGSISGSSNVGVGVEELMEWTVGVHTPVWIGTKRPEWMSG